MILPLISKSGTAQGVEVLAGYVGSQFTEGEQTIRASLRAVVTIYRPQAFASVTGL